MLQVLRINSQGPLVAQWQHFLRGQGYYACVVTGTFDVTTQSATKEFQRAQGLDDDGVVGQYSYAKAIKLGFAIVKDDVDDRDGPNWPPTPGFNPLSLQDRATTYGSFTFSSAPVPGNPEAIQIGGTWVKDNIVRVTVPQLMPFVTGGVVSFHKKAADKLKALFEAWEAAGLLDRVLTWDGGWAPRFVRGSRTYLSNHCLPAYETVWTTEGSAAIADLKGFKGQVWSYLEGVAVPGRVTGFFENGRKPILKISLRGHVLRCTPNHPILVLRKKTLPKEHWIPHTVGRGQVRALYWTEMVRAEDVRVGDRVVFTRALPTPARSTPVNLDWAEILGLFLGDGFVGHRQGSPEYVAFCFPDGDRVKEHVREILTHFFGEAPKDAGGRALTYYRESVFNLFTHYDQKARAKTLPSEVWEWPADARVRLLLGLLYSDGTVVQSRASSGGGLGARYRFKLGSKELAEGTRMLLTSMGFRVERLHVVSAEERAIKGRVTLSKEAYVVGAVDVRGVLCPDADPLYLERVLAASNPDQGNTPCWGYELLAPDFTHRIVQKIEQDGTEDVYDIEVDDHHNFVTGGAVVSNSWGTAFDINAKWNYLGARPALVGERGCVRELVEIANAQGWFWGGHYGANLPVGTTARIDGMHFELVQL